MYFFCLVFFQMEDQNYNPWAVSSIDSFNYLCCPECIFRSKTETKFKAHAIEYHPQSKTFFYPVQIQLQEIQRVIPTGFYSCSYCDFTSKDHIIFEIHITEYHPEITGLL